jgi:isoquinoline 1-oxidoreductase subunit beta
MQAKVGGTAEFGIDVRLPGMPYAAIRANPHLGRPMLSHDPARALAMPGVARVLPVGNGAVAAVARNTWQAMQAADAVESSGIRLHVPPTRARSSTASSPPSTSHRRGGCATRAMSAKLSWVAR